MLYEEDTMMVDGRRQSCVMDGMAVPCSTARQAMEIGAAIPAALEGVQNNTGFRYESHGLGIYTVSVPRQVGWNVTYRGENDTRGTANPVYSGTNTYSFSFNWNISVEQQRPTRLTPVQVGELRNQLKAAVDPNQSPNGKLCNDFLRKTLQNLGAISNDVLKLFDMYAYTKKKGGGIYNAPGTNAGGTFGDASSARPRIELDLKNRRTQLEQGKIDSDALILEVVHEIVFHGSRKGLIEGHNDGTDAMYEAGRELGFLPETDLPQPDPKILATGTSTQRYNELGRTDNFKQGEEFLKKACGGSKGWVLQGSSLK